MVQCVECTLFWHSDSTSNWKLKPNRAVNIASRCQQWPIAPRDGGWHHYDRGPKTLINTGRGRAAMRWWAIRMIWLLLIALPVGGEAMALPSCLSPATRQDSAFQDWYVDNQC